MGGPIDMMLVYFERLLCVTMRNVQGYLQLQSSVQLCDIAFVIKKSSFCGALF